MSDETKFCSNCGAEIDAKAEICPGCGVRVNSKGSITSGDKPTAAFVLSLIAGVLIVICGLGYAVLGAICGSITSMAPGGGGAGAAIFIYMALGLISGVIVIAGAVMINKAEPDKVKKGSILVVVFSIVGLVSGGGFYIGTILGIIGGVLGLVWKPPEV